MAESSADPKKFDQAVRAHRQRVPMTKADWRRLSDEAKEKAFTVAEVTKVSVIADVWKALDAAIEKGTTLDDFKAEVGQKLEDSWGKPNAPRVETIFRTNLMNAYSAGRAEIYTAPAVKESRPYLRFDAIEDSALDECDQGCPEANGTTLPQDDPYWETHTPPLHFNCRCVVTPLSKDDVDDSGGLSDKAPDADAADGFGRPPSEGGQDWGATIGDMPPDLAEIVRDRLDK